MNRKFGISLKHNESSINALNLGFLNQYTQYFSSILILTYSIFALYFSYNSNVFLLANSVIAHTKIAVNIAYTPVIICKKILTFTEEMLLARYENKSLKDSNAKLQSVISGMAIRLNQFQNYQNIEQFASVVHIRIIPLKIIYYSNNKNKFAILNSQNISLKGNNPVMCNGGLAGRIVDIYDKTSKVLLIENEYSYIPIRTSSSGVRGVLNGDGHNIYIKYTNGEPKVGEFVVTANESDIFAADIPVGVIESISKSEIKVRKMCDLSTSSVAGVAIS